MKKASVLFSAILFVSTFASAQKIETVNGVRIVHNERGGKWGNIPEVRIELVRMIGGLDADANLAFNQKRLDDVLQKSLEYCLRLDRIALYFISLEDVRERIFNPYRVVMRPGGWKTEENTYSYDYQLIRKTGLEEEKRILIRENGKPCRVEDAPLKTRRFNYKYLAFGLIGLLGDTAQRIHSYLVEDEVKIWRKPALVVRVVPREPDNARWLYGRAWVSPADGSVFKIEWQEESLGNYEETLKYAQALKAKPALRFTTEYQYEKNGIRFPSRFTVEEDYSQASPGGTRKIRKSELQITLKDYKFFTVETEVNVRR
jgi:hypothetical protein